LYALSMRALPWIGRGLVFTVSTVLFAVGGACGDDDGNGPTDAGFDQNIINPPQPPPPERDAAGPPEGIDTTGRLGSPQLVADVGESTDGPSWSVSEGVLYFTTPSNPSSLRKLVVDAGVTEVKEDGGGDAGSAIATASGGTERLFVSDRTGVTVRIIGDGGVGDAGAPPRRYSGAFTQLGDIAVDAELKAGRAFVVDTGAARAYEFLPSDLTKAFTEVFDARKVSDSTIGTSNATLAVTSVAVGLRGSTVVLYVGVSTDATGAVFGVSTNPGGGGLVTEQYSLQGTPPNGIALDDAGYLYVAWARGIDVYPPNGGKKLGSTPGLHLKAPPTSLAFGGADRRTLYVTTATGKIYAIPTSGTGILR